MLNIRIIIYIKWLLVILKIIKDFQQYLIWDNRYIVVA